MKNYILRAFFLCCFSLTLLPTQSILGQYNYRMDDMQQYWFYRYRLINQFLKIGPKHGESIPSGIRNLYGGNKMHWGDGTSYLGNYIGVLATEYALLKKYGDNIGLEKTKEELYYALKAYERLDYYAESTPPYNKPNKFDGFFIRDDVPIDFMTRSTNSSHAGVNTIQDHFNRKATFFGHDPVNALESDFASPDMNNKDGGQDQIINLMMGLSLVTKLVDNCPTITVNGNTLTPGHPDYIGFSTFAKKIATTMMYKIHDDGWIMKRPDGNKVASNRGGVMTLAEGLNHAFWQISGYHIGPSGTHAWRKAYWNALPRTYQKYGLTPVEDSRCEGGFASNQADNIYMICMLAALGDSWDNVLGNNKTQKYLHILAKHYNWHAFYQLLWAVRLGKQVNFEYTKFKDNLSEALSTVPCNGPSCFGISDNTAWNSSMRWEKSWCDQTRCQEGFTGNYNGLDYMLFHNLYLLYYNSPIGFGDLITRQITTTALPSSAVRSQYEIAGFEHLIASSNVGGNSNNSMRYIASEYIQLKPGFNSGNVKCFNAKIMERSPCTSDRRNSSAENFSYGVDDPFFERRETEEVETPEEPTERRERIRTHSASPVSEVVDSQADLIVFPNPVEEKLNIQLSNGMKQISIYDSAGKQLFNQVVDQLPSVQIDLSALPTGIHVLTITNTNGALLQRKISKL